MGEFVGIAAWAANYYGSPRMLAGQAAAAVAVIASGVRAWRNVGPTAPRRG